ncbi:BTB/POZ and MATH domain-containing protein 1-like [Phragmites australis]|uniref:BTB/POZ and MATH domain-containing protein 1-like n=1 Tax=Phragmites australis TaxID=29695 RepID=UPI002D792EA9|nr:BTB/POZ and MATH domain-containing protein 1-like [Phragmites australis]
MGASSSNHAEAAGGSQSLPHDLGELLHKGTGSDVTLVVSGESFAAHKAILASRSPVFMAEFFGHMKEKLLQRVEIKDMEAAVFRAMLSFIYTDSVPEPGRQEDGIIIAQHLLVAADRYGLDRLKSMCEDELCNGLSVETAATTLALAEQHGCSRLKDGCVEHIAANLDAVMATEGYKHLMASFPSVMNDLLRAVRAKKN